MFQQQRVYISPDVMAACLLGCEFVSHIEENCAEVVINMENKTMMVGGRNIRVVHLHEPLRQFAQQAANQLYGIRYDVV